MLVGVHPAALLSDWAFGDFQSLKLSPGEHPTQPIEASQLAICSDNKLQGYLFKVADRDWQMAKIASMAGLTRERNAERNRVLENSTTRPSKTELKANKKANTVEEQAHISGIPRARSATSKGAPLESPKINQATQHSGDSTDDDALIAQASAVFHRGAA